MNDRDRDHNREWNANWNRLGADNDEERDGVVCAACGAPNRAGAAQCGNCGHPLPATSRETIIEVTSGDPRIVPGSDIDDSYRRTTWRETPGGFSTATFDRGRVIVARGGSRGCLITLALFALVSCCVCWLMWSTVGGVL